MNKLRIILVIILVILLPQEGVKAQDYKYFVTGGGVGYSKMRNTNMSPLLYQGLNGQFKLGYNSSKEGKIIDFYTAFYGGFLTPDIYPELSQSKMTSLRLSVKYNYLREIKFTDQNQVEYYAGFSLGNRDQIRIHNQFNNNNYDGEYFISLELMSALKKQIRVLDRKTILRFDIFLPLISYIIGPSYSHPEPFDYLTDPDPNIFSFLKSGDFFGIGNFFGINTQLQLIHYLNNGNGLGLSYEWDFLSNNAYNHTVTAGHFLSFSTFFNLSKDEN